LIGQFNQLLQLLQLLWLEATHGDGQVGAVGVTPMTGGALLGVGDNGSALPIGLKDLLGAELDANATALAPGTKDRYVAAGQPGLSPGWLRNWNGGSVRRFIGSHIRTSQLPAGMRL
jgi:hypothetical protein